MRLYKSIGLAMGASAIAALLAAPLFADDKSADKFDAYLRMAMSTGNSVRQVQAMNGLSAKSLDSQKVGDDVRVLVKVSDSFADLQTYLAKNGGTITSRHGVVACVRVPYKALSGIAQLDSVEKIDASHKLNLTNDVAAGAEHGTNLASFTAQNKRYQGQGVLVGVIDTGIDTSLDAFKDADGNSRILYLWDQNESISERFPTVVTPEGESRTYKYGSEYTAADVDAQTEEDVVFIDTAGHGTHVCGTLAGRDEKYPGMAPQAQYMVVATNGGETEMLNAYEYLLSRAKEMNRPLVVNVSMGGAYGPHDGTSSIELAIQHMVDKYNLISICATGNDAEQNSSAIAEIPAEDTVTIHNKFDIVYGARDASFTNAIEMWSTGSQEMDVTISNGSVTRTIAYDEQIYPPEPFDDGVQIGCVKEIKAAQNGDDRIVVFFVNTGTEDKVMPVQLQLHNKGDKQLTVNLYTLNGASPFQDHICSGCLLTPATTPGVIAVGAYASRSTWKSIGGTQSDPNTVDDLTSFSSCGPVRRPDLYDDLDVTKPDIVAPGSMLISQLSQGYGFILQLVAPDFYRMYAIDDTHIAMNGTSMATPVVSGTVALMLQNMPQASAAKIKEILHDSARSDSYTEEVPNDYFGYGKLDASCVESQLMESPQPTIAAVGRNTKDKESLVITGSNFVPASDVYINGIAWAAEKIVLVDSTTMIIEGVYSTDSPLLKGNSVAVESVKVVNFLGKKGANTAEYQVGNEDEEKHASSGSGGCFIATAAYGSYLEPEVMTLRRFRDRDLITNAPGREFVKLYYRYSPPVAAYIAEHPCARFATRVALTPLVYSVSHPDMALAMALALGLGGGLLYRRRRS